MIRRYTLPEMGAVWTEQARFEQMLRVEIAVARAQSTRGLVPADALAAIEEHATVDVDRIAEIEPTTDHDVIAFVSQVAESVGPDGRYLHLGLTCSDVVDTGLALQLRAAGELLLRDCDRLLVALIARARTEADTVMMGRTHSVHAEPTTLGPQARRLGVRARPRPPPARGGRRRDRDRQDLRARRDVQPPRPGHRGRGARGARPPRRPGEHPDRPARPPRRAAHGDRDRRRLPRAVRDRDPEPPAHRDRRAQEPFKAGQKGSSAMPHKRNPILPSGSRASRGCSAATPARRSRTSRSGTSATSATAPPSG